MATDIFSIKVVIVPQAGNKAAREAAILVCRQISSDPEFKKRKIKPVVYREENNKSRLEVARAWINREHRPESLRLVFLRDCDDFEDAAGDDIEACQGVFVSFKSAGMGRLKQYLLDSCR